MPSIDLALLNACSADASDVGVELGGLAFVATAKVAGCGDLDRPQVVAGSGLPQVRLDRRRVIMFSRDGEVVPDGPESHEGFEAVTTFDLGVWLAGLEDGDISLRLAAMAC